MSLSNPFIAYFTVFIGGIIASTSPCSLVVFPMIIGYVGAYSEGNIKKSFLYSLVFSAGLSITFTILGAIAAIAGILLGDVGYYWKYLLSAIAIIMGFQILGFINIKMPGFSTIKTDKKGLMGALFLGMLFGITSSPCATPILGIILAYVASNQNLVYGISLLFIYAIANSALVFLIGFSTGLAESFLKSKKIKMAMHYFHKASGLIIILGAILFLIK